VKFRLISLRPTRRRDQQAQEHGESDQDENRVKTGSVRRFANPAASPHRPRAILLFRVRNEYACTATIHYTRARSLRRFCEKRGSKRGSILILLATSPGSTRSCTPVFRVGCSGSSFAPRLYRVDGKELQCERGHDLAWVRRAKLLSDHAYHFLSYWRWFKAKGYVSWPAACGISFVENASQIPDAHLSKSHSGSNLLYNSSNGSYAGLQRFQE
jgi:hypothetical protein